MNSNGIRKFVYKYSVVLSAIVAVMIVLLICLFSSVPSTLPDKPTLVTISVTLAGFLFTGQGIMLALPLESKFMQLVKQYGYFNDFHTLCHWAEMVFIVSVVFSLEVITNLFTNQVLVNTLFLFTFLWPLIMTTWALWIFGNIIRLRDS